MMQAPNLDALEKILKRERSALLIADFGALDQISREKERLLHRLAALSGPEKQIGRVRALCKENQELILAVQHGLADARHSLLTLVVASRTRIYQTGGATQELKTAHCAFSQKI